MRALRLDRFRKLQRLCLRQNEIQKIELPTTCASTLQDLELYDNVIKKIDGLQDFREIRSLDLSFNNIRHIKRLSELKKLDHLYLIQNRLSKIENLEELTDLVYLELGANRIEEIEGLENLTKTPTSVAWVKQDHRAQGLEYSHQPTHSQYSREPLDFTVWHRSPPSNNRTLHLEQQDNISRTPRTRDEARDSRLPRESRVFTCWSRRTERP